MRRGIRHDGKTLFFLAGLMCLAGRTACFADAGADYLSCPSSSPYCTAEYLKMGSLPKIDALQAYEAGFTGKGVTVAVVDSGVLLTHNEFVGKISPLESVYLNRNSDYHGTHVAGTVLAAKDGVGMHGVAYNATLLSFATDFGNLTTDLLQTEAFEELTKPQYDHIKIINNSWGYIDAFLDNRPSFNFEELLPMKHLAAKDKLLVFSAGNYGRDYPSYPAAAGAVDEALKFNIINVVAYDNAYTPDKDDPNSIAFLAQYSDNAKGAEAYSISAPGGNDLYPIYSATDYGNSSYMSMSGTSMATPHVSGVAALVQEAFPYMGGKQIADVILSTADNDYINVSEVFFKVKKRDYVGDDGRWHNRPYMIFITDRHGPWTDEEKNEVVAARTDFATNCAGDDLHCVEMTYAEVFGQGFLNAGAAVKGPKYLNAARLREVAYSDIESGYFAPSDYQTGFAFDGGTVDQFFYTVDTKGYDSVWSHDIGEQPSTASGYEAAHVGLNKQGGGRLILSGNNTFAGVSRVAAAFWK